MRPVSCIVSRNSDVANDSTAVTGSGQRHMRPMMKPNGRKNTILNAICSTAVRPSVRMSPMNCSGLSCGVRWCAAQ